MAPSSDIRQISVKFWLSSLWEGFELIRASVSLTVTVHVSEEQTRSAPSMLLLYCCSAQYGKVLFLLLCTV